MRKHPGRPTRATVFLAALICAVAVAVLLPSSLTAQSRNLQIERARPSEDHRPRVAANVVTLPAGSVNGLQDAIAQAGPRGIVLVEAGSHVEESVVVIDIPVSVVGEPGAVIESITTPYGAELPQLVEGALHVLNTSNVTIYGLELRPLGMESNTAILIENSPRVTAASNVISGYTAGIVVQNGDRVDISGNNITLTGIDHGITIVNGSFARITDNVISNTVFGIWACDFNGHAARNVTTGSFIGLILCNVPPALLISGQVVGSEQPATGWHVQNNSSSTNVWGYAITDGSSMNVIANNAAADNGIDIEVLGDSTFFGFFTPAAFDNVIAVGPDASLSVHDCGLNTIVSGNASLLGTDAVPCF
jgi:hypothetical protein